MSRLEIRVDGKDVEAGKMLSIAVSMLKILKSIERQIAKEQGVKSHVQWRIDMQSGHEYGLIAIRAESDANDTITQRLTKEVMVRLKGKEKP